MEIGDKVYRIRFIDCFNKVQAEVHGLTVTRIDRISDLSIPSYSRIRAEKKNHLEEGANNFFHKE